MTEQIFFSRDLSWLTFNQRVLEEAARSSVPLGERLRFLSIYSSNLDEFYRVRMPVLLAKQHLLVSKPNSTIDSQLDTSEFVQARQMISEQLTQYGQILRTQLLPALAEKGILLLYNKSIPESIAVAIREYFFTTIAAFLQPVYLSAKTAFFPENNKLYLLVALQHEKEEALVVVNIPSSSLLRFFSIQQQDKQYIVFIDDIIKSHLPFLFSGKQVTGCYSFKITRDAGLNLEDELPESLADKIEKQVANRDLGSATRLLHQPQLPLRQLQLLCNQFKIAIGNAIEGGMYHNLKDIAELPLNDQSLFYPKQSTIPLKHLQTTTSLLEEIKNEDIIVHTPYNNYGTVLRFFNEAAIDEDVAEIYVTLYRIASDSKIANALISAAKNGKKVQVFVELKARFDEANNISWAKKMKEAGVKVIYSIPKLKVHAKIALVKKKMRKEQLYFGLLSTGNMNESTARFYTDHILMTAHTEILQEMEKLFLFLANRKKPEKEDFISFKHLLVAQFNLQHQFLTLIDREIENAKRGLEARIAIKLNNLEEQVLIRKLYEASNAGVQVQLIVRSICCLVPGVAGMSENITIKRIIGRYLEHGRVFVFHNDGDTQVFMGSADWMNRNIYTRIEVCFPIYDERIKNEMLKILQLQLQDNVQAVWIDQHLNNIPVEKSEPVIDSQAAIYQLLNKKNEYAIA
jgi:polyphosphate kinase